MTFSLMSTDFAAGATIPQHFTGEGDDASPSLRWNGAPAGTKELALVCVDPDAPSPQPWVHWVLYKIPSSVGALPENLPKRDHPGVADALQGRNSWGRIGYGGPMPPPGHGRHHYDFALYALDEPLDLDPGASLDELRQAMKPHVLGEARLTGTYERH